MRVARSLAGSLASLHVPARLLPIRLTEDDDASTDLWSEFSIQASASASEDDQADEWDDDDDEEEVDWDEPVGPEEPPDGVTVYPVAKFLPLLLKRKYGDDWEELLANALASASPDGLVDDDDAEGFVY